MTEASTLVAEALLLKTEFQSAGGGDGVVSRSDPEEADRPRTIDLVVSLEREGEK